MTLTSNNYNTSIPSRLIGPPNLAIEIASPGTATYDRLSKYEAYEQAGVSEYWIAYPEERSVEVLALGHGEYESIGTFQGDETLQSQVAPGITIVPVHQFFA